MKLTLKNNFHSTSVELECSGGRLSAKQVANARKTLCGVSGCTCGGNAGERGPQRLADGRRFAVVPDSDGGVEIELE